MPPIYLILLILAGLGVAGGIIYMIVYFTTQPSSGITSGGGGGGGNAWAPAPSKSGFRNY